MPFPAIPDPPNGPGKNPGNNRSPWSGPKPPAVDPRNAKINPRPFTPSPTGTGTYVPKYPNLGEMPNNSQWINRINQPVPGADKLREQYPPKPSPPNAPAPGAGARIFNAAAKLSNIGLGIQLGNMAADLFSPPNILSNDAEKRAIEEEKKKRKNPPFDISPPSTPQNPIYPFNGGQDAGILYEVWIDANGSAPWGNGNYGAFPGPIHGIVFRGRGYGHPVGLSYGNNEFFQFGWSDSYAPIPNANPDPIITLIRRIDGQPDTTNPPPIVPGISYPPTVNITFNGPTINGPTINNFPSAPTGFPTAAPPPAASPPVGSSPGGSAGANPTGAPTGVPDSDRPPAPESPPITRVPTPFGVPVGTGAGAGPVQTNIRINDPVRDAAERVNPNAFSRVVPGSDATITTTAPTPPTTTLPVVQPPTGNTPPINDSTRQNGQQNTQVPPLFTPIPAVDPTQNRPLDRNPTPPPVNQTPPGNSCCVPTPIANSLDRLEKKINPTDLIDWSILGIINNKLGNQVNGGISGFMQRIHRNGMIDRTLNVVSTVASLHNAAMLSRDLGATLMETTSQVLAAVGIKDSEGNAYDFNQIIGGTVSNWIKGVIGADNFNNVSQTWIKANRILTAGSNLVDSVRSMSHTIIESQEIVGSWVAKIGNGMSEDGLVGDETLPWFPENPDFKNPLFRVEQSIASLTDATDSVNQLASSVIETQELYGEINRNYTEFKNEITAAGNTKRTAETTKKNESASPTINNIDLKEGTPPDGN